VCLSLNTQPAFYIQIKGNVDWAHDPVYEQVNSRSITSMPGVHWY